jgi:hypothetical protein
MQDKTTAQWVSTWVMATNMYKPSTGPVFGGWDTKVKEATQGFRAELDF